MEMMHAVGEKKIYVDENFKSMLMDKFSVLKKNTLKIDNTFSIIGLYFKFPLEKACFV